MHRATRHNINPRTVKVLSQENNTIKRRASQSFSELGRGTGLPAVILPWEYVTTRVTFLLRNLALQIAYKVRAIRTKFNCLRFWSESCLEFSILKN